ncbi:hypothetical protein [Yoonia sp. SDW83-1]|uniref:hypothetical protein n=1 Tax=Yoonia sp. SDW83-1 TaxID=3366945 RepID=UPI00398C7A4A
MSEDRSLPIRLSSKADDLRRIAPDPTQLPHRPFVSGDARFLSMQDSMQKGRFLLVLPMAIALLLVPLWLFQADRQAYRQAQIEWVADLDDMLLRFGEQDVVRTIDETSETTLRYVYPDKALTYAEYLHYRWTIAANGPTNLVIRAGLAGVFLLIGGLALGWILLTPRRALIWFDRDRRAVFTWRKGRVLVAPWEQVTFHIRGNGLHWLLWDEGRVVWRIPVPTADNPVWGSEHFNLSSLAILQAFMDHGLDAVSPRPFVKHLSWTLREDRQPKGFASRRDGLLAELRDDPPEMRAR